MMKILVILFLIYISCSLAQECPEKEVICFWGSWSVYRKEQAQFSVDNIDPALCTNIVYTFIGLNTKLEVDHIDSWADVSLGGFENLTSLKKDYPCLKTTLAIGGWADGSIKYSVTSYTEESRKKFADQILKFLVYYGFDGVDIDWEYPNSRGGVEADKTNFPLLLKAIKDAISPWGFGLTVAVAAQDEYMHKSYDTKAIAEVVDYIQLMAYDFTSPSSETIGLSASISVAKQAVEYWLKDVPPEKLILGLQAYGRTFVLADPAKHSPGDPSDGPGYPGLYTNEAGFLAYYEVLDMLDSGMEEVRSDGTNYAYYDTDWITFENDETIMEKVTYALDQNLGGVMIWSIDLDDFNGSYGRKFPLLNTVNEVIENYTRKSKLRRRLNHKILKR